MKLVSHFIYVCAVCFDGLSLKIKANYLHLPTTEKCNRETHHSNTQMINHGSIETGIKRCCIIFSTFHKLNVIRLATSSVSKYPMNKRSHICVNCVIWKQIHEKCESVITDSWPTFSYARVRYWAGPSHKPPSATECRHYITTNWPQVVPQKAHRCEDKQKSFDPPLLLGTLSVYWVIDFGFLSLMLCTWYQLWASDEMQSCVTSFWLYFMQFE